MNTPIKKIIYLVLATAIVLFFGKNQIFKSKSDICGNYWVYSTIDDDTNMIKDYECWLFDKNDSVYVTNLEGENSFTSYFEIVEKEQQRVLQTRLSHSRIQIYADSLIVGTGRKPRIFYRSNSVSIDPANYYDYLAGKEFVMGYGWGCGFNISKRSALRYEFYKDTTCSLTRETTIKIDSEVEHQTEELVSNFKYLVRNDSIKLPTPLKSEEFVYWHINQIVGLKVNKLLINNKHEI